jgi:archaellum biogenesis protein FlaJ (TadC family)
VSAATNAIHYASAAVFFLTLAYVSLVLFTKVHPSGKKEDLTKQKVKRNRVYRACGITILVCIGLLLLVDALPKDSAILNIDPVFWIEAIALLAFGFSWLIKGEVALRDKAIKTK